MATHRTDGTRPDVVIIGAGPCGLAAAIAIQQVGLRAVVLDKGCVVSSVAGYPTYMTFFSTAERIAIGGMPFPLAADKPTRRDALAYYRGVVAHFGLDVRQYEPVTAVTRDADGGFTVVSRPRATGTDRVTRTRAIVFATGYFSNPNLLGVPGEDLPHVSHVYHEGHEAFRQDAVVVGGGNSAVDAALDLYRSGARATLVHFGPTFDKNIKPWVLPDITNRFRDGSIGVRWNARVTRIEPGAVLLTTADDEERLPADHVYLMTGYTPRPDFLVSLGVPIDAKTGVPAHDPATMETSVPGVFLAGVIANGNDANRTFIEDGRDHGSLIARRLAR